MQGTLKVSVISAILKTEPGIEAIDNIKPFITLRVGHKKYKTKTFKEKNVNPVWNEVFIFELDGNTELEFIVHDATLYNNNIIGSNIIDLIPLLKKQKIQSWYPFVGINERKPITDGYLLLTCEIRGQGKPGI